MPIVKWERPRYAGHDVLEMVTVAPKPDHEDEQIRTYPEHVLMLLRDERDPDRVSWGLAWLVHDVQNDRWGQRMLMVGPSPDDGDAERKRLRQYQEEITGRIH